MTGQCNDAASGIAPSAWAPEGGRQTRCDTASAFCGVRRRTPILAANDVHFSWDEHVVLDGFSLAVERGQIVCLMGVNGCGKSTFLDCVLGENRPESGSIFIDGRNAIDLRARDRARLVSYVPQMHERMFPYTVEHMVSMGRTAYQDAFSALDDEDRARVDEALAACGIAHLRERPCTALSGGEMQMTLLARALVQDAPLIVLDEPTAHLDFRNELIFLETIERLVAHKGTSVLMATHSPNQAFHLSAAGLDVHVALMERGTAACQGPPDRVLTPQVVRRCFGVEARVVRVGDEGESSMRQIVPLATVRDG